MKLTAVLGNRLLDLLHCGLLCHVLGPEEALGLAFVVMRIVLAPVPSATLSTGARFRSDREDFGLIRFGNLMHSLSRPSGWSWSFADNPSCFDTNPRP